jgi:hypothetical protein
LRVTEPPAPRVNMQRTRLWFDAVAFFEHCDALRRRSDDLRLRARAARAQAAALLAELRGSTDRQGPPSREPAYDLSAGHDVIAHSRNILHASALRRAACERVRRGQSSKDDPS